MWHHAILDRCARARDNSQHSRHVPEGPAPRSREAWYTNRNPSDYRRTEKLTLPTPQWEVIIHSYDPLTMSYWATIQPHDRRSHHTRRSFAIKVTQTLPLTTTHGCWTVTKHILGILIFWGSIMKYCYNVAEGLGYGFVNFIETMAVYNWRYQLCYYGKPHASSYMILWLSFKCHGGLINN